MNDSQLKVKDFLDNRINELQSGLDNLQDRDKQPTQLGNFYNSILRHNVEFEIDKTKELKKDLIEVLA